MVSKIKASDKQQLLQLSLPALRTSPEFIIQLQGFLGAFN